MKKNLNLKIYISTFAALLFTAPLFAVFLLDNGDGTVIDRRTGLVWQKCSSGQNNDVTCSGTSMTLTWANALTYCNGLVLGGRAWRLPNINELKSIADKEITPNPASIDNEIFPNTAVANNYWSSSTSVSAATSAWGVSFSAGGVYEHNKTFTKYVRCVSGP